MIQNASKDVLSSSSAAARGSCQLHLAHTLFQHVIRRQDNPSLHLQPHPRSFKNPALKRSHRAVSVIILTANVLLRQCPVKQRSRRSLPQLHLLSPPPCVLLHWPHQFLPLAIYLRHLHRQGHHLQSFHPVVQGPTALPARWIVC